METLKQKPIDFDSLAHGGPIRACCEQSAGKEIKALRTIIGHGERQGQFGYVLHSEHCDCPDRWLRHDWRKGDA